jgi:hypothetical protein
LAFRVLLLDVPVPPTLDALVAVQWPMGLRPSDTPGCPGSATAGTAASVVGELERC